MILLEEKLALAREFCGELGLDHMPKQAALSAYIAAGQAIVVTSMPGDFDTVEWARCAPEDDFDNHRLARAVERLAGFVRVQRSAPAEALFRFAGGPLTEPGPAGAPVTELGPAGGSVSDSGPAGGPVTEPRPAGAPGAGAVEGDRAADARDDAPR